MRIRIETQKRLPAVLLATRSPEALNGIPTDFQTREAVSTLGVMSALHADPVLFIVDVDDLVECPAMSREALRTVLASVGEDGAVVVSSEQFTAASERWIGEALLVRGLRSGVRYMPPRVVMVTNFCGGVGKTTLTLSTAKHFRKASGLATAVVEVGVGGSSLNARLPGERASLYEVVTQAAVPGQWEGAAVYPSDNWEADSLATDERTLDALRLVIREHTLTVFDAFPSNPLWGRALELATDVVVVTAPRPDSLAQTDAILRQLKDEIAAWNPQPRIHLVLNQVRSMGERLPLAGQVSAWIGYDERKAQRLASSFAEPILDLIYPGWTKRVKRKARKNGRQNGNAEAKA
ncbi:MAG: hypothetical protein L6300_05215 [Syntrophaceae bacterium]|nr:hypothetical protein [Syntrophaceae bacterium]